MSRDSQIPKSTDQLQADLAALKLKIALQECRERELDRLMEGYAGTKPWKSGWPRAKARCCGA